MKNPALIYLAKMIIFHDPKSNYLIKGDEKLLMSFPSHKSLFSMPAGQGLPIGNYTSQFFANIYLNELDQYAKRILKCENYFRYMDDLVIFDQSRQRLRILIRKIDEFLKTDLKLRVHPKKIILQPAAKGVNFLGYIIYPAYSLSRKRAVGNIKMKLKTINSDLKECQDMKVIKRTVINAQCVVNSYWGHFKHADCGSLKKKIYEKHFGGLKKYLEQSKNKNHFIIKNGLFPNKK